MKIIELIKSLFYVCLILIAAWFVKPMSENVFYYGYYFGFIFFIFCVAMIYFATARSFYLLSKFYKQIKNPEFYFENLQSTNKKINKICDAYKESFVQNINYRKTRSNSDLYFGPDIFLQEMNRFPVVNFLRIIPGTFIGLGILGTFIGFSSGLSSIDLISSETLLEGVQQLIFGLKSAFNTSIIGVCASVILNFIFIHPLLNKIERTSRELCDYLDSKFFITEVDAMATFDENGKLRPFPITLTEILTKLDGVSTNINFIGQNVGEQVTDSIKKTIDKTIEDVIGAEINKMKETISESVKELKACSTTLQNAPQHLRDSSNQIKKAAEESIESVSRGLANFNQEVENVSNSLIAIKNSFETLSNNFSNINSSISEKEKLFRENQQVLTNAICDFKSSLVELKNGTNSLTQIYVANSQNVNTALKDFKGLVAELNIIKTENKEMLSDFTKFDEELSSIFANVNENVKDYSKIVAENLSSYLVQFNEATNGISEKFAESVLSLKNELSKFQQENKK